MEKFEEIRTSLDTSHKKWLIAMGKMRELLLKEVKNEWKEKVKENAEAAGGTVVENGGQGQGRRRGTKSKNDRRDYYWIDIVFGENKEDSYCLALSFLECDWDSGNLHTQFGRVQFQHTHFEGASKGVATPNRLFTVKATENGVRKSKKYVVFMEENCCDPTADEEADKDLALETGWIYDPNFDPKKTAKAFVAYVIRERGKVLAGKGGAL